MPNSPSAEKRVRQNSKRRALNRWRKSRIKSQIKAFDKALQAHDFDAAEQQYRKACGLLDEVACTKTIHKNAAARRKSRLSRRFKEARQRAGAAPGA